MKKTIFLIVLILAISVVGIVNAKNESNPFNAVWDAIDDVEEQIERISEETADLQEQIDAIDISNGGSTPQPTAFVAYMYVEGIEGESTDKGHEGWIEITGYAHGVKSSDHKEFTVTKRIDKATPLIMAKACSGGHLEEVDIELCRTDEEPECYMKYKFKDVLIAKAIDKSTPKLAGKGDSLPLEEVTEILPVEEVSFTYGEIEWTYETSVGEITTQGWDTVENRPTEEVPFN